ncbi:MAG: hypothetical protein WD883_02575 [Candidatus Colwellbacteria bacterium]
MPLVKDNENRVINPRSVPKSDQGPPKPIEFLVILQLGVALHVEPVSTAIPGDNCLHQDFSGKGDLVAISIDIDPHNSSLKRLRQVHVALTSMSHKTRWPWNTRRTIAPLSGSVSSLAGPLISPEDEIERRASARRTLIAGMAVWVITRTES